MIGRRFTLFTLFGFRVQADASWLIIAALITWSLAAGLFPLFYPDLTPVTYWAMGVAGAFGLFVSIVFHEMSHALVGRRYGVQFEGITLWIFGGIAEMTRDADKPRTEFLMAAAGPLASFLLAGLFYLAAAGLSLAGLAITVVGVLSYLAWLNLILGVFNLVPAYPLDGGRILRSALWYRRDDVVSATRIASAFGNGFGWLLIGLGIFSFIAGNFVGGIWWILIGAFIRFAAKASFRQFLAQRLLTGAEVRKMMNPNPSRIAPETPVSRFMEQYLYSRDGNVFPVGHDGHIDGIVDMDALKRLPRSQWDRRTVGEFTRQLTEDTSIAPDDDAARALQLFQKSRLSSLMVTRNGHVEGVLSIDDLERYLQKKTALESTERRGGGFGRSSGRMDETRA